MLLRFCPNPSHSGHTSSTVTLMRFVTPLYASSSVISSPKSMSSAGAAEGRRKEVARAGLAARELNASRGDCRAPAPEHVFKNVLEIDAAFAHIAAAKGLTAVKTAAP